MWLSIITKNSPCYWESNSLLFLQDFLQKCRNCGVAGENRDRKKIKIPCKYPVFVISNTVKCYTSARNNKMPQRGILLFPVERNGTSPSQSQIAGSTTSRFDQCNAVKSSRLPRSRHSVPCEGIPSSPPQ